MRRLIVIPLLMLLTAALPLWASCAPAEKKPLSVFIAGSVMGPFDEIERAYEAAHPDVDVQIEAHGSIQVIRHVTDIHQKIDVVVTADHDLIPLLMYQTRDPDTGKPYADWYIEFATNRLALGYSDQSQYADEINQDNWYEVIARPGVKLGLPDPRFDPSGYRGLMVLQLAEDYYDNPTAFDDVIAGRFRMPIRVQAKDGRAVVHVPEIVEPKPDTGMIVRGASIALIALLQSGDIDYAFEYESVIRQAGLKVLSFPDELSLGSEAHAEWYSTVQILLDFQRFASVQPLFTGNVIGYGVTIPSNAPNPEEAEEFVAFLLSEEGKKAFRDNYHPLIEPARANNYDNLPERLRDLAVRWP